MNEEYARQVLRAVLGRVCQPLGVHGMQTSVCDALVDVLRQYLITLGRTTTSYCTHANRTEPNLCDLSQAFQTLDIDLADLSEFLREVESQPLEQKVPKFPVPRNSCHVCYGPASYGESTKKRPRNPSLSSEDDEYDHIPPYFPPFPSQNVEQDKDEDGSSSVGMEVSEHSVDTVTKGDGLATPTPMDPLRGLPQLFRSRGFSSDFSEDGEVAGSCSRRNSTSEGQLVGGVNGSRMGGAMARASTPGVREDIVFAGKDDIDRSITPPTNYSAETGSKKADLLETSPVTPVVAPVRGFAAGEGGGGKETFLFPTIKPLSVKVQDIRGSRRKWSPQVPSYSDASSPATSSRAPLEDQARTSSSDATSGKVGVVSTMEVPASLPTAAAVSPTFLTPSPPSSRHTSPPGRQQATPIVSCSSSSSSEEEDEADGGMDLKDGGTPVSLDIKKEMKGKEMKVEVEEKDEVEQEAVIAELAGETATSSEGEMEEDEEVEECEAGDEDEGNEELEKKEVGNVGFDERKAYEEVEEGVDLLGPVSSSEDELEEERENDDGDEGKQEERLEEEEQQQEEEEEEEEEEEGEEKAVQENSGDMADIALEQLSSDEDEEEENEEKGGVLGFDQELLPERLSFSPAPPPVLSLSAPPTRACEETEIETTEDGNSNVLEEVATLESGMGGVCQDESRSSSVGLSTDKSTILSSSSCSSFGESEDSKVERKPALPYLPSPLRSSVKGRRPRGQPRHRNIPHLGAQPPMGGFLPCSPLVVHVKRHMVPSLRKEEEELEDVGTSAALGVLASSRLKTKAEIKAEQFVQATPYQVGPVLQTPSSSPTPPPSPPSSHASSLRRLSIPVQEVMVMPLMVTIDRHLLSSKPFGHLPQPHPPLPVRTLQPSSSFESPPKPSASRVKKMLARFGGGASTSSSATTPTLQGQTLAPPSTLHAVNPRKRELDISDLTFNKPASKRYKEDDTPSPAPPTIPTTFSSSASSSSSDEDDGEEEGVVSMENSTHSTSSSPAPPSFEAQVRLPACPPTPSSIEERDEGVNLEEDPLGTPESQHSSSSYGSRGVAKGMAGFRLTINKSLLPSSTVQHLGEVASEKGSSKKGKKIQKSHKASTTPIPALKVSTSDLLRVPEEKGRGSPSSRGNAGASGRGRPSKKKALGQLWGNPLPPSAPSQPVTLQGSETICPECGLKDDGSPMIGCDHCDAWLHWMCCNITAAPPEDQKWFCPDCQKAGVGALAGSKKKGRKKKKH